MFSLPTATFLLFLLPISSLAAPAATNCPPNLNTAGINLVKEFEGWRASPYKDPVGEWTVGYGHLCNQDKKCAELGYKFPMTKTQGQTLLQKDLKTYETCLSTAIGKAPALNANQYAALVSWTYNMGCGNMKGSSLISRLNKGGSGNGVNQVISQELPKWVYAGKNKLDGLVRRRAAEVKLATTKTSSKALPC